MGTAVIAGALPGMMAGIRAEDIVLGDRDGVSATVAAREYLGADTILRCRVGTEQVLVRAGRTVRTEVGESVRLSWPADALHLFDGKTGRRLAPATERAPEICA
jgi:sn-glycerol 3-phosphate transport system ATP-binding protein